MNAVGKKEKDLGTPSKSSLRRSELIRGDTRLLCTYKMSSHYFVCVCVRSSGDGKEKTTVKAECQSSGELESIKAPHTAVIDRGTAV